MKIAKDCPFCGEDIGPVVARQGTKYTFYQVMHQPNKKGHRHGLIIMDVDEWNTRPIEDELRARIAELEAENDILKDHLREARNILIDKKLQIDSLYEAGYKLQQRIAELEEKQRWRVVANGELPEDGEVVWLWDGKYIGMGYYLVFAGQFMDRDTPLRRIKPTHWMPLPESPNDTQTQTIVYGKESEE